MHINSLLSLEHAFFKHGFQRRSIKHKKTNMHILNNSPPIYKDPRPSLDGSCSSPRLTFSISSLTPCSPLTRYILLSSDSSSFNSEGRTESRKLNSGNVDKACSTDEENLAGWAVARVTHVVSLVLFGQQKYRQGASQTKRGGGEEVKSRLDNNSDNMGRSRVKRDGVRHEKRIRL